MILYLIKSTVCMTLLLLVYLLFLEKEKMHSFNRAYLLLSLAFSLTIPVIPVGIVGGLSWTAADSTAVMEPVRHQQEITGTSSGYSLLQKAGVVLYGTFGFLLLMRLVRKIDSILFRVRRHTRMRYENATLVLLKAETIPYSFLSYIFVNEKSYRDGRISKEVLIHENAHIRQKHTLDILFVEVLKILFWFNPVFHWYKKAIQLNHEFLADQAVVNGAAGIGAYQSLLLQVSCPAPPNVLTSRFNSSMTKKRLLMMTRKTSRSRSLARRTAIVPVVITACLLFGCQVTGQEPLAEKPMVTIGIESSDRIKLDKREITLSMLDRRLEELSLNPDLIVELDVQPEAYFGTVTDVQKLLRSHKLLRVNYIYNRNSD